MTFSKIAYAKNFLMVSASPLTRSSYHASDDFKKLKNSKTVIFDAKYFIPANCIDGRL